MTVVWICVRVTACLSLIVLISVVARPPARAQAPAAPGSRILVLPFASAVGPHAPESAALWLGEAAAILLTDELTRLGFGALARDERVAAFEELQLPMSATLTRATMIRAGEIIGASEVVYGEVVLDEELAVRARIIDLATGRQLPEVTSSGGLTDLFPLFRRVAEGMSGGALPTAGPPASSDWDLPLEAFESYVKGLVAATPASQRRFLESALAEAPHDPHVLTALWDVYTADGEHELALAAASAVREDVPEARRARYLVARSLLELGRIAGAGATLRALDEDGSSAVVANALGVVELRQEVPDPLAAAAFFARAVTAEPGTPDYLFNRGYAHALAGETAEALVWLREAVRFDVSDGEAHLVMAAVLHAAGRQAEAAREWELTRLLGAGSELATGPPAGVPAGLERLAPSLSAFGVARTAAAVEQPAQRDQAAAAEFHLAQGRRLVESGRDRDAVAELQRAVYLSPYADEPHLLLGGIYRRIGRLSDAIDEFTVAIWSRESLEAHLALGDALLESGDRAGARRQAERALVLAPGSAEARALLVRAGGGVVPSLEGSWPKRPTGKSS